jgi:hypothetical protein
MISLNEEYPASEQSFSKTVIVPAEQSRLVAFN